MILEKNRFLTNIKNLSLRELPFNNFSLFRETATSNQFESQLFFSQHSSTIFRHSIYPISSHKKKVISASPAPSSNVPPDHKVLVMCGLLDPHQGHTGGDTGGVHANTSSSSWVILHTRVAQNSELNQL